MPEFLDPIRRFRLQAQDLARAERDELLAAHRDAVESDVRLTEAQQNELERSIASHSRFLEENAHRIEALLPRTLRSIDSYETSRNLYRSNLATALRDAAQISVNDLWGQQANGRDHAVFASTVSRIKRRLGECRGYAGALHRKFLQIEVELIALEQRGLGLAPAEPVLAKAPKKSEPNIKIVGEDYDPRTT